MNFKFNIVQYVGRKRNKPVYSIGYKNKTLCTSDWGTTNRQILTNN